MNALQPQVTLKLIQLFDFSANLLRSNTRTPLSGVPKKDMDKMLDVDSADSIKTFLDCTGYVGFVEAVCHDELVLVELEEGDDPEYLYYRSPETYLMKHLPIAEAAVFQVNHRRFLEELAGLFDIPLADQHGIQKPLINDVLWKIGTAKLHGGFHVSVYVVRSLSSHFDNVHAALAKEKTVAIVLSTSKNELLHIRWPEGITVCCLSDAIASHLEGTKLNKEWLYKRVISGSDTSNQVPDDFPIEFDPYRGVLGIHGKADWYLRGKQLLAIKFMYEQSENGRWELPAKEILAVTRTNGQVGGSQRMESLFASSKEWQNYLHKVRRGMWSFKLD